MTTLATALLISGLLANHAEVPEAGQGPVAAGEHPAAAHVVHSHHAALFGGVTYAEEHASPTFGLEYEYRLPFAHQVMGVGPIAEAVLGDHTAFVAIAALWAHPVAGLKIGVGPGAEIASGHAEFLLRGGLGYDLHLGPVTVSPSAFADLVAGHFAYVGGVGVGMGF